MSPVLLLSILLQIGCAVHVVRTGRPMYWLFLLLIGSYIAAAVYLIAAVIPSLRNALSTRRALRLAHDTIDPQRQPYEALTGYTGEEARVRHARLLARHGDADKARSLLQETLDRSAAAPHYYRKLQRDWIEAARRELQALAPR